MRKHAAATEVHVELTQVNGTEVRLCVQDNGRGFDQAHLLNDDPPTRFGLLSVREQVEALGGRFGVESAPGRGTAVWAVLPSGRERP